MKIGWKQKQTGYWRVGDLQCSRTLPAWCRNQKKRTSFCSFKRFSQTNVSLKMSPYISIYDPTFNLDQRPNSFAAKSHYSTSDQRPLSVWPRPRGGRATGCHRLLRWASCPWTSGPAKSTRQAVEKEGQFGLLPKFFAKIQSAPGLWAGTLGNFTDVEPPQTEMVRWNEAVEKCCLK